MIFITEGTGFFFSRIRRRSVYHCIIEREGTGFEFIDQHSCSYLNTRIGKPSGDDELSILCCFYI